MKARRRVPPDFETDELTENFVEQLASGKVADACATGIALPALQGPTGQAARVDRCFWKAVTLTEPKAQRLRLQDARIENSDLASLDLTGGALDRVEIIATRLTGAAFTQTALHSVLFRECTLDLTSFRMARFKHCAFEQCNLTEADLYGADLSGTVFAQCDLSRADISHANLAGADLRNCRLDGMRGTPASMDGLIIGQDQAPLLITLFGVRVLP